MPKQIFSTVDRKWQQRVLRESAPEHRVLRAGLDHPRLRLTVVARHVDVDPRVRVDPLHPRHGAPKLDGLRFVEFGRERVMRPGRQHGGAEECAGYETTR